MLELLLDGVAFFSHAVVFGLALFFSSRLSIANSIVFSYMEIPQKKRVLRNLCTNFLHINPYCIPYGRDAIKKRSFPRITRIFTNFTN